MKSTPEVDTAEVDAAEVDTVRGRGRPRTFDEEAVLDALTQLFTEQGYEATSMADISKVAGLNKSSLYNTFGSKHELFEQVLDRYVTARLDTLAMAVEVSGSGMAGIHAFLDLADSERETAVGRYGCLAISTGAELGASSPEMAQVSAAFRARMRATMRSLVEKAAEMGEVDPAHVDHYATMLMMFMSALSVSFRSGADDEEVDRAFEAMHATIESWRI